MRIWWIECEIILWKQIETTYWKEQKMNETHYANYVSIRKKIGLKLEKSTDGKTGIPVHINIYYGACKLLSLYNYI